MKETLEKKKRRASSIVRRLRKTYPDVRCALHFSNPWELLVATILSAQCTDKRVNKVTPVLFKKYPKISDYAGARVGQLESIIRSTGFYRNKAKNIIRAARVILAKFEGEVPRTMESLITIPGVGRKTANVVLGNAFGIPGISVDTHMIRLNRLLGFTRHTDPVKIEFDLMQIVPRRDWTLFSSLVIRHGRTRCPARRPDCPHCEIARQCASAGKDSARISETYGQGKARDNFRKGSRTSI
ncbi:MAG TPA: endonuclease III [Candidatus Omnitrophota bacterium]|nr:endonuclease III [Candidatus Omnitrophota bacterium]